MLYGLVPVNADTLSPSEAFPYLGKTITYNKSDWAAVYLNTRKARMLWSMIAKILERTGATVRSWVVMYKAVAQSVILYGIKSWVVKGDIIKVLEGFHHRAE